MKIQRDWFHGDMISSGIQWVTPQNWISTDPPWDQVFCMVGSDMFQKSPKKKNVSPVLSNYLYGVSKEERPTVNGAFSNKKKRILDALHGDLFCWTQQMKSTECEIKRIHLGVHSPWNTSWLVNPMPPSPMNSQKWVGVIPSHETVPLENHGGWEFRWIS